MPRKPRTMSRKALLPSLPLALLALLALVAATAPAAAQSITNVDLYEKSLQAAQQAVEYYGAWDNPEQLDRVNRIGYELAQHSEFNKFPFTFGLVNAAEPNAMALPGGQIFVTRGMIETGLDDDMLANVLGHEIAHVTKEHYLRMQRKATLMNIFSTAVLAGVVIGADRSRSSGSNAPYDPRLGYDTGGDIIQGAAAATLVLSELLLRSHSRDHEDESDLEGQRLAAAAGYNPDGARAFWAMMESRAPQLQRYGYWQTHPFAEDRIRAAEARRATWTVQKKTTPEGFRVRTQATLANYMERHKPNEKLTQFLKESALATWPQGKTAETYRLENLHRVRDAELAKPLLSRDYGAVLRAYRDEIDEIKGLDAKTPLAAVLTEETADLDTKRKELFPKAVEVLDRGIYETSFLVAFLSNFPDAPQVPEVALALGDAYSRLGNQTEGVTRYLQAWESAPDSAEGKRARAGLKVLTPTLQELAALQQLAAQDKDPELKRLANERLPAVVKSYTDVANGAEYLRRFPDGDHVAPVLERLNVLADNLYSEVVLYQGMGDGIKAIDRINKILTHAPLSPAAEKLRDRVVLSPEKAG
jgi:predicted Zn-dependent protease